MSDGGYSGGRQLPADADYGFDKTGSLIIYFTLFHKTAILFAGAYD